MKKLLPLVALAALISGCSHERETVNVVLQRAESCADLEALLKEDAHAKMNAQIDQQIDWLHNRDRWLETPMFAEDGANTAQGGGGEPALDHSETNVQVEGVDEADIVKTNGNFLYILHGGELEVANAWPASTMALASSMPIEGLPTEMFLTDSKLVVFSQVDDPGVFQNAGLPVPRETYGDVYYWYPTLTKATVFSVAGAELSVERELYFEGYYNTARRVGSKVRLILNGGYHLPGLQYYPDYNGDNDGELEDAYEALRKDNNKRIDAATLSDFVPARMVRQDGALTALPPSCTDYYVPTAGTTESGMTQIHSFDLDNPDIGPLETQVVGYADTVYASADNIYLAGRNYMWGRWWRWDDWNDFGSTSATHLHKFDIATDPLAPIYEGSGSIEGHVLNQFSLDEHDGHLRVATTDWLRSRDGSEAVNHVFVVADQGMQLNVVGSVEGLAPGETVQSARFVEGRGYVVTFRQMDPLFVVDLAEPTAPKLLGELEIPGFSEYMHPIEGGSHLLTIGRDGGPNGTNGDMALQIFDVSNATEPRLVAKQVVANAYSEAEYDHKAFTFYKGMLAVPAVSWNSGSGFQTSTLELFDIDVNNGFTHRGSVNHTALFQNMEPNYCYWYGYGVRRGVFVEDYVYSISEGGVVVNQLDDMNTPVAVLELPHSEPGQYCYY